MFIPNVLAVFIKKQNKNKLSFLHGIAFALKKAKYSCQYMCRFVWAFFLIPLISFPVPDDGITQS